MRAWRVLHSCCSGGRDRVRQRCALTRWFEAPLWARRVRPVGRGSAWRPRFGAGTTVASAEDATQATEGLEHAETPLQRREAKEAEQTLNVGSGPSFRTETRVIVP